MPEQLIDLDCVSCGACCVSDWKSHVYVSLSMKDVSRLVNLGYKDWIGYERGDIRKTYPALCTRRPSGEQRRCIALEGDIGVKVRCTIYDNRPAMCAQFKAGSSYCAEARKESGLE